MYGQPKPSDQDMEACFNEAVHLASNGENPYPGMTYIQGVRDALAWALGESEEPPLEFEERD